MVGLAIGLFPLVSVWRVSGQVLQELPSLDGVESADTHHRVSAFADPDFILARRVYENTTTGQIRQTLVDDGYQSFSLQGEVWYGKECCGDYDGVWVSIAEAPDRPGATRLLLTTADGDNRTVAGLFGVLGLLLFIPGVAILASGIQSTSDKRRRTVDNLPETIG